MSDNLTHSYAIKQTPEKDVAVAEGFWWNEDMASCPMGTKVQLLTKYGVAVYGELSPRSVGYVAWAPLPKRRDQ